MSAAFVFAISLAVAGGLLGVYLILIAVCLLAMRSCSTEQLRASSIAHVSSDVDLRVDDMLRHLLSASEYHTLMTRGYLDVASGARTDAIYRIPRRGGMVTLFESGRATIDLCVQPADPLPGGDVVMLHKLMIQANEDIYVATARQYPSRHLGKQYRP